MVVNLCVSINSFVEHVIHTYPNAIHLFGGLRTELQEYIDAYIKLSNGSKFMCIAERPTYVSFPKRLLYRYLSFKYNPYISVFLALGETGVMSYYNLGFRKPVLYPFMYNPSLNINTEFVEIENEEIDSPLKFLYLGRFDYKYKGCDLLMEAFDSIQPMFKSKWSLTLVGGYGDQKDEIISWATTKENVYYTGSWHQNEILKNMSQFDVCIVPSRQDGWNLNPNYSIFSHIGTIVSNEAVSQEIILNSESGLVYDCCDVQMLTKHLEFCIKNREVVIEWKKKAIQFMDRVSSET
jgi:glycosyltransferase involved in cell wall biosynthesis